LAIRREREGEDKGLYVPRGITLPWIPPDGCHQPGRDEESPGAVDRWAGLKVRRLAYPDVNAPLPKGTGKSIWVWGSEKGLFYPFATVERTQGRLPLLVVEGEFDSLIGNQEVGHLVHVATLGSASNHTLAPSSLMAVARCSEILLAFDHDQAGANAVRAWRKMYPDRTRRAMLPFGKDLNEFHQKGGDVLIWANNCLNRMGSSQLS
jgi:hypothetical protein